MAYIGVSPSNGVRQKHTYTATASQTTFSGAGAEGVSLSYRDSNYVDVYRNGVKLGDADYTATSGTSIVLGEGAAVSDIVEIVVYDVFSVADTVSKADGGTFDGNVTMAGTLAVTGETTLATHLNMGDNDIIKLGDSADLRIYHDGLKSRIEDVGTGDLEIFATNFGVYNHPDGKAYLTATASDEIRLYYDNGSRLATTSDGILVYGNIANSGGDFRLDTTSSIILDAGGDGQIELADTGTTFGILYDTSNNFGIYSAVQDKDIIFQGNDGGSTINALTLDMSEAGAATFVGAIQSAGVTSTNNITMNSGNLSLYSTSDGNQVFRYYRADGTLVVQQYPYNNRFNVQTYNNQGLRLKTHGTGQIELEGNVVINEDSADLDFRVESNSNSNMLFVDSGNNKVGIAQSSPVALVDIGGSQSDESLMLRSGDNNAAASGGKQILFGFNNSASYAHNIRTRHDSNNQTNNTISFYTWQPTQAAGDYGNARIADFSSNGVVFNEDSRDADFRVESDSNVHMFFVDAGNNKIGINYSQPKHPLHVNGTLHTGIAGLSSGDVTGTLSIGNTGNNYMTLIKAINTASTPGILKTRMGFFTLSGTGEEASHATEKMSILADGGNVLIGLTTSNSSAEALQIYKNGLVPLSVARQQDGSIVHFRVGSVNGATHGSISISGTTCSYNAFSGSHWSRLSDNSKPTILKGTIIETIDEMCDWYSAEFTVPAIGGEDEYVRSEPIGLPSGKSVGDTITYTYEGTDYTATIIQEGDEKHVKCKISDTADSKRVYGVFADWDNDDDTVNDMYVTAVGTHVVRVHSSATISAGDLLVSNGDGTAKVQDDDIIRSKTIGKVLTNIVQETYDDGSYTVPCALYCG
jgi:hypothetical protein